MILQVSSRYSLILCLFVNSFSLFSSETISVAEDFPLKSTTAVSKKSPNKGIDIQKVMDYQMPHIIARYRKDYKTSEENAKVHEIELKRYLILAGDSDAGDSIGMMSTEVDNLWHTFLLFTKEYQAFCNDMFGKFIHHCPKIDEEVNKIDSRTITL